MVGLNINQFTLSMKESELYENLPKVSSKITQKNIS